MVERIKILSRRFIALLCIASALLLPYSLGYYHGFVRGEREMSNYIMCIIGRTGGHDFAKQKSVRMYCKSIDEEIGQ